MTASELTFTRPWGRLAAKAWGPPEGKPWLALHGWLDNAATFDALAPRLPPDIRLVAFDLPGHGHSDWLPVGIHYVYVGAIPEILGVMDALGWSRCGLLGHSLGGTLSTVLAASAPERIEAICLLESTGPMSAPAEKAADLLAEFLRKAEELPRKRMPVYRSLEEAAAVRASAGSLSNAAALTLARRQVKATEGGFTWRSDPRLRLPSPTRFTEEQVESFLRAIRCPALTVRAEPGFPLPTEMLKRRSSLIPGLRVERIPGGHHVHLDDPETVARVIAPFLLSPR